ncbi:MAG: SPFH domain-containing protein [Acidobacteria bacterium]|nr:SPFH domain-containing protein [Bryobacteraceae bacterium CoA2 C42]
MKERIANVQSGYLMLLANVAVFVASAYFFLNVLTWVEVAWGMGLLLAGCVMLPGSFTVQPNEAVVLQLFGRYVGTVKDPGLRWANPFFSKKKISLRVRNFETNHLKVNDHDGNPIEIAAVVVWRVVDSAEATFQVDDYSHYVTVQAEAALRNLATVYPYDAHEGQEISLRGSTEVVAERLKTEIQSRLAVAGVEVTEARISHLAYAPEIAAAMLQRQQAGAIIAARAKIVEGAVGMVEMALDHLNERAVVNLDEERKAAMVSNLLVVLCSERNVHPVVNTGTLHH